MLEIIIAIAAGWVLLSGVFIVGAARLSAQFSRHEDGEMDTQPQAWVPHTMSSATSHKRQ